MFHEGKSVLFTALACLDNPGTSIVIVPFQSLLNGLVSKAKRAGIESVEWQPGMTDPATLVFVFVDLARSTY